MGSTSVPSLLTTHKGRCITLPDPRRDFILESTEHPTDPQPSHVNILCTFSTGHLSTTQTDTAQIGINGMLKTRHIQTF